MEKYNVFIVGGELDVAETLRQALDAFEPECQPHVFKDAEEALDHYKMGLIPSCVIPLFPVGTDTEEVSWLIKTNPAFQELDFTKRNFLGISTDAESIGKMFDDLRHNPSMIDYLRGKPEQQMVNTRAPAVHSVPVCQTILVIGEPGLERRTFNSLLKKSRLAHEVRSFDDSQKALDFAQANPTVSAFAVRLFDAKDYPDNAYHALQNDPALLALKENNIHVFAAPADIEMTYQFMMDVYGHLKVHPAQAGQVLPYVYRRGSQEPGINR